MVIRITLILVLVASLACNGQIADSLKHTKPSLGFIENKGQVRDHDRKTNSSVKFLLSLPGTNVALKGNGFSYDTYITEEKTKLNKKDLGSLAQHDDFDKEVTYKFHRVDVKFVGGDQAAALIPSEPSNDVINYYANNDRDGTPMHHFGKVTYKNVYPNIDIEFVAKPGSDKPFEYNFIVRPGGDISQIQLSYKGANKGAILNGGIELTLAYGMLTERIPASYYQKNKQHVAIGYKNMSSKNDELTVGFAGSVTRPAQTLIIDPSPTLSWGTYFGGSSGNESATDIETDASGNLYITGYTQSTSGIATSGSYQSTIDGSYDVFVAKFDANGARLWSTYYGDTSDDKAHGISLDPSGNISIIGTTSSKSGIATAGSHQAAFAGTFGFDAFVVKFNSAGMLLWGSYFGYSDPSGGATDKGHDIATDLSGNIFFVMSGSTTMGLATAGAHQTVGGGWRDAVLVKFNTNGVRQWSTYYGGSGDEDEMKLEVDVTGNVVLTGLTFSNNNIATPVSHQPIKGDASSSDGFIVRFGTDGVRQWGTYYGGTTADKIDGVSCDNSSNIYVFGTTSSSNAIATPGTYRPTYSGGSDKFVVKFSSPGIRQWGTYIAKNGSLGACTVNQSGEVIGATSTSISTLATICSYKTVGSGSIEGYIFKLNATGSALVWATYYGGPSTDYANAVALDATNNVYIAGHTGSSSGIATPGAHQTTLSGMNDMFIARFSEGSLLAEPAMSPASPWVYLSFPATFTAANHQGGNAYHFSYVHLGATTNVYSGTASTNVTLPALGTFQVRCVTTTATGCSLEEFFSIEVRKAIAMCQVTIPLVNTGDIKLDKFSGIIVFQPNDVCKEPMLTGCIGGKADAPFLNNVVSASATTFSDLWPSSFLNVSPPVGVNSYERNERGKWRPKSTHTFNRTINYQASSNNYEAGRFKLSAFNWDYPQVAKGSGWLEVANITKYTPDGNPVEERNALNIASVAKFGYKGSVPYLIAQNAEYSSVYFEGFENVYGTQVEEGVVLTGGSRTNSEFHSGANSLSLTSQFTSATLTVNNQIQQKGLQVRFWAKGDIAANAINVTATAGTVSAFKVLARSGAWALLESTITGINAAPSQMSVSFSRTGGGGTWIDDLRIQPVDAEMTCYVYDVRTLQLLTVLDDQHFGMFYQYSAEGKLTRRMVETEKGLKTIQETQYNMPTINKTTPIGQ